MQLRIQNLSKRYPNGVQALANVSLDIPAGMFGLLGPNGAGKSTLMRTLATLQEADSGSASLELDGGGPIDVLRDKPRVRELLGYLPQEFGLYPKVTALDLLDHLAILKGLRDRRKRKAVVDGLLQRVNLHDARHRRLGGFSGGMKQRFGIAQALLGSPKLLIVDEPTAGLDPEERLRFLNLLADIGSDVVVLLSTHIVADVADLCRRLAIVSGGRVVRTGDPLALTGELAGKIWRREIANDAELEGLKAKHQLLSVGRNAGRRVARIFDASPGAGFETCPPELEDVYFLATRAPGPAA
jgi:ABC-type multidrug transport system ATPase subunit